jgi:hypothetical protein
MAVAAGSRQWYVGSFLSVFCRGSNDYSARQAAREGCSLYERYLYLAGDSWASGGYHMYHFCEADALVV